MQDFYCLSIQLLLQAPFFGHLLLSLPKEEQGDKEGVQLAWLSNGQLGFRVGKLVSVSKQQKAVLLHELTHLIFQHPFSIQNYQYTELYSLAAELTVNEVLAVHHDTTLPLLPSHFGLTNQQTTAGYYQQLVLLQQRGEAPLGKLDKAQQKALAKHRLWLRQPQVARASIQLRERVRRAAQQVSAKEWGLLPKAIQVEIQQLMTLQAPTQPWHRLLRLFCAQSRKTYLKTTLRRPSKRYPASPGTAIKRRQHLLVAVDTSGSIAVPLFERFFQEIYHIWKTGAQVTILYCDTQITERFDYQGQMPSHFTGRGGTNFEAPIRLANAATSTFDAIIYLTDGEGPKPLIIPRIPLLWLIAGTGGAHLDGQKLRL